MMNKILVYTIATLSVLVFSFFNFMYYAFSGGVHTYEFTTGVALLLVTLLSVIALILLKYNTRNSGKVFIISGILALIVMSLREGNPIILFIDSFAGMVRVVIPLIFIIIGIYTLNYMKNTQTPKMNTKFVGHHISAGGFIFYKNKLALRALPA